MAFVKKIQLEGVNYDIADAAAARASAIADVENGTTASKAYSTGDYLYRNDTLYKVINDISLGDSFVVDTNIEATDVMSEAGNISIATTSVAGIVKPDGTSILVDANGVISASADMSDYIEKSATEGLVKNDGTIDTSKHVHLKPTSSGLTGEVQTKTWSGLTNFRGDSTWTDGENIYYSKNNNNYILDKSTSTWSPKSWTGLTSFDGLYIWTDGDNIYFSLASAQLVLDKSTSIWSTKTWNNQPGGLDGSCVWTDGTDIYFSFEGDNYVLDKSTSTLNTKSWTGLTSFYGDCVWTDGENIYYSYDSDQYVLDKSTGAWSTKNWNGLSDFIGALILTDGENIYYSSSSDQYILNKSTSTWSTKAWSGLTNITGNCIWTDGNNIYYSNNSNQYVFINETVYADGFVKSDGTIDTNTYAQTSDLPGAATSSTLGLVKPDNSTITVDANGTISSNVAIFKLTATLAAAATSVTFTDSRLGANTCVMSPMTSTGILPLSISFNDTNHTYTATFEAQESAVSVAIVCFNFAS